MFAVIFNISGILLIYKVL
ncbi:sortase B protein-sorting domain-containing protein [Prevotella sp.]|nr:sortase B protein-sorting domain-containing protein [Prevotella sp.]MBF1624182.1 sortase B protein-sorting domain-containing protein [Prevotella sp.]